MKQPISYEEDYALELDKTDSMQSFRKQFYFPENSIYMDGNSLGLLSKKCETSLLRILNEWKTLGIKGWMEAKRPWFYYSEEMGKLASPLVGADRGELLLTGSTTVNIHSLISTFYEPSGKKTKILADELNFPSDIYALKGEIKMKGRNPSDELILITSRDGRTLDENNIIDMMTDDINLIFLPSVLYKSGQLLDIEKLTCEAHKRNIIIGFDCSHSAGVVPHFYSKWGVDFGVFCSYKYLNGGPGSPAFLYINKKHFNKEPLLSGWFGNKKEIQFNMLLDFHPSRDAGGWQISSPCILSSSTIEGSLEIILEAGIENIRAKSLQMTTYLSLLIQKFLPQEQYGFTIITPSEPDKRGGHIAIEHPTDTVGIYKALISNGIIPDFRPPNIIRIAPIPLYNTFHEIWTVVQRLKKIMDTKEYKNYDAKKKTLL